MKDVLVLGAGLVSKPLVEYLIKEKYDVTIGTRTVSKAKRILESCGYEDDGKCVEININVDDQKLRNEIKKVDVVVSLLPYIYHPKVAKMCIDTGKHMITTSYVSELLQKLNEKAKDAGILIMNECGLDPGIDHMSAMKIINNVHEKNGRIDSFRSYCGGLPAPDSNNNPLGYKFSWSPIGVIRAGRNDAKYLDNGKEVYIPSEKLFDSYHMINIQDIGELEAYPNRNAIPYIEKYDIPETRTMYRGTLRYPGWCALWKKFVVLGLLDETKQYKFHGLSYRDIIANLIGCNDYDDYEKMKTKLASYLKIDISSEIMKKIEFIGLISNEKIPMDNGTLTECLADLLSRKLKYEKNERDMILLHHEFVVSLDEKKKKIYSTLVNYGIPNGDTAMARTVGLPAAITTKLILENKVSLTGVHIPTAKEVYEQVLAELQKYGIIFNETIVDDIS